MQRDWADHRRSRCTIPQTPQLEWRIFLDEDSDGCRSLAAFLMTLSEADRELAVGSILALRELAAKGEIPEDDDAIGPVRIDPDLFELRWDMFGALVRQYHAEPQALPDVLVLLHMHQKHLATESDSLTKEMQDQEISYAALRYAAGEKRAWIA